MNENDELSYDVQMRETQTKRERKMLELDLAQMYDTCVPGSLSLSLSLSLSSFMIIDLVIERLNLEEKTTHWALWANWKTSS